MPAPRVIKFTALEIGVLVDAVESLTANYTIHDKHPAVTARKKLDAALAPAPKGVAAAPLEEALVGAAGAKVARLAGPSGYARASRLASQKAATPEQVAEVGRWVARWWSRGPLTLLDVLSRWDTWLPKALAERAPAGLPEGLNGGQATNVGPGATGTGGTGPGRRRSPGLG